ncbi:eva-1 homolog Bb [Poeciliopsis prolifica]|uniref:eva-1 homolog Bb n=1 Tax=Poeciliopsis prolifica TaxID=188132 RepID=UPI00241379BF|nr:eva-1 homolog Bb [Poeciliopsis prolifica]XP_054910981.1 eva-1 homolog Bb [Poeciliopsis prolifica]
MDPVKADMELLSDSMAAYAHIKANPESFALYFMMGVSFGLFTALCLLVAAIACRSRGPRRGPRKGPRRAPPSPDRRQLKESSDEEEEDEEESMFEEDGAESEGKVALGPLSSRSSQSNGTLRSLDVFTSAEELEKARRLEQRERIVREIWRNGQPDVMVTGTGTIGRVQCR